MGLEDAVLERIIDRVGLSAFTPNKITGLASLGRELAGGSSKKVRTAGFALGHEEIEEGLMCVAALVFDERGATHAAINILGPVSSVGAGPDDNISAMRQGCRALSEDLGPESESRET